MNQVLLSSLLSLLFLAAAVGAQVPFSVHLSILKAEDTRRYDKTLEDLMKSPNADIRGRAALAAGRIGREEAIPTLAALLTNDSSEKVRVMAAFALGEIESLKAADAILKVLQDSKTPDSVRSRAVEAAGKIAAANAKDEKSKMLGEAILDALEAENRKGAKQSREVVLMGLTAALRAKPEETDVVVAKFLTNLDARVRADAGNTLSRIKAKNANEALRAMVLSDDDPVARANAARALGAAEDKEAFNLLLEAAIEDDDSRVRVSAIRSLAALKDAKAAEKLLVRGTILLELHRKSKLPIPSEKSELLEIAVTLGRLMQNTEDNRTVIFLNELRLDDGFTSPETEIAFARVAPKAYVAARLPNHFGYDNPLVASAYGQGMTELATTKDEALRANAAEKLTAYVAGMKTGVKGVDDAKMAKAMPDLIRGIAAFKPDNLAKILRELLTNDDIFIRAAAAELLAEQPVSDENIRSLQSAFSKSVVMDKAYNDAQLAVLDALFKLDKKRSVGVLLTALDHPDYLVRKKALEHLKNIDRTDFPGLQSSLDGALRKKKDQVLPYTPVFGTKLGQVLNTNADYQRAVSRRNGTVRAVLTTEKGAFTIDLLPEDAPLTVDNFIKLARSKYFNGVEVHRVVPNFVMQDGDPRGDGNGGPGWSIRCEVNMVPYERGAVGMALSGKDTGGSQWFVTHSPQPHLDGGYTVFGRVNETDMKIVDNIVRGDKILSVRIVEVSSPKIRKKGSRK